MTSSYFLYDPKFMQSPAAFAMAERMNGVFSPLEILPEAFTKAYELPIGEHVEKTTKGFPTFHGLLLFATSRNNSLHYL